MATYKRILAIDIGGTGLKAAVIDHNGKLLTEHLRVLTPHPCPPALMVKTLVALVKPLARFDCISIGFPGVVRGTKVITAPHLGTAMWAGYDLAGQLSRKLGKPAKIVNDADMQGLAVIKGEGLEFVITLGTGIGTALFYNGVLIPNSELGHLELDGGDYEPKASGAARDARASSR